MVNFHFEVAGSGWRSVCSCSIISVVHSSAWLSLTLLALSSHKCELRYEKTFITKNSITNPTNYWSRWNFYTAQPRMLRSLCEYFRSLAQKTTELRQFFKNWQNSRQFKRVKDIPAMHFFQSLMEETKISVISRCEPRH